MLGTAGRIETTAPTANIAGNPCCEFEIDSSALFSAIRAERAGGPCLLGYYHSHPGGRAKPSETDRAAAAGDGKLWLVVASGAVTAWRSTPGGFEPVELKEV